MATKMGEDELTAIIEREAASALTLQTELSKQRQEALDLYFGAKSGELAVSDPNRSQVVSRDVMDTIEWILPSLLRIFTSGDETVKFEPQGPEDEASAKQATEYCNYVFNRDNPGFLILYTFFKDALLQKNGIVKTWWEVKEDVTKRTVYGISDEAYSLLLADPDIEIVEHSEVPGDGDQAGVEPAYAASIGAAPPA